MTACAAADLARTDADLNAAYADARAVLRELDASLAPDRAGAEAALRDAQRAWITFRDLACEAEAFAVRGGSIHPMLVLMCKTRLTEARAADLRDLASSMGQ